MVILSVTEKIFGVRRKSDGEPLRKLAREVQSALVEAILNPRSFGPSNSRGSTTPLPTAAFRKMKASSKYEATEKKNESKRA